MFEGSDVMPSGSVELLFVLFEMANCAFVRCIFSVGRVLIVWSMCLLILFVLYRVTFVFILYSLTIFINISNPYKLNYIYCIYILVILSINSTLIICVFINYFLLMHYNSVNQWSPNYGPLRLFIRSAELFLKNIYTHLELQVDRIISGHPSFRFLSYSFHWRIHEDFRRKIMKLKMQLK